jgi:lipoprotein-anchoring transpeptidase ErfK/SrfK
VVKMSRVIFAALMIICLGAATVAYGHEQKNVSYGYDQVPPGFATYIVKMNDTWSTIAPEPKDKTLIMKVNKIDSLTYVKKILVPVDERAYSYVPVPAKYATQKGRRIFVAFLAEQYFGAYDENGKLFKWGPISSGGYGMKTPIGTFRAQDRKVNYVNRDGAKMPYAVRFHKGYFFHQYKLPGRPASHGCVRLLMDDAQEMYSFVRPGDIVKVVASISTAL